VLASSDATQLARHLTHALIERGAEQFEAWVSSLEVLRGTAGSCIDALPAAADFAAILEYELPRDDRRPDVIVLENGTVVVIEFKNGKRVLAADVDQVNCYARDLKSYHSECHDRNIAPFLVPLGYAGPVERRGNVVVTPAEKLPSQILALTSAGTLKRPDPARWLRGRYAPLPGLAQAARTLYQRAPLPRIKRADSAGIPKVVARLLGICSEARRTGTRRLALLTGVPGSGKTLVGLQLVHGAELDQLVNADEPGTAAPGVFLSGNGPLVDVLQHALGKRKDFVQPLRNFLVEYTARSTTSPPEHVIVFDEAQRAWDAKQVSTKHRGELGKKSEPELLLEIAERSHDWCVVLGLLGEGQEIHTGEEGGLDLWADALRMSGEWVGHAPPHVARHLAARGVSVTVEQLLDLNTMLRSHAATDLHRWVTHLLDSELAEADDVSESLIGYDLYVTRDFETARQYVRARYVGQSDRRYGLLASSCAEDLRGYALRLKEDGLGAGYGRWYEGRPTGRNYCCSLETAVSEFGCQGLELDYAIVCWGDDLAWTGSSWMQQGGKRRRGVSDSERLRRNSYRVLLTRGRDGMCIFVPPDSKSDGVHDALQAAGARPLVDA